MNESAQMQGRWKGREEGRQCKPEPVRWQHIWNYLGMKSPRLNFIADFSAHFHRVLSFSENGQTPLSAVHKSFTSQGSVVSYESPNTLF